VEGGTLATAAIEAGTSQTMTVRNPWAGQQAEVVDGSSGAVVVSPTTASTFGVPVTAGKAYLVQRPSAPTASLPFAQVTGAAARTSRALGSATIGLSGNSLPTGNTVSVTSPGNQTGTVGVAISGTQVQATDSASGQTLTYKATGLPAGLSIDSATGLISGTPTGAAIFSVTVTATDGAGTSGSAAFTWTISSGSTPTGTCHVVYTPNEWQGGFTANVTISNTGTDAVSNWTARFTFPGDQKVTSAWNASVTQAGATVTAVNAGYNGNIPPGADATFGFQGTWTTNDSSPTAFTVNGAACA
jgi:endo-1,4-beta-xylanase